MARVGLRVSYVLLLLSVAVRFSHAARGRGAPPSGIENSKPSMGAWWDAGQAYKTGVFNTGKPCGAYCEGGPCPYCGADFCCKKGSFRGGCDGSSGHDSEYVCTPAPADVKAPMNLGKECLYAADCSSGRCGYCGSGLCCKQGVAEGGCDGDIGGVKNHECVPFQAFHFDDLTEFPGLPEFPDPSRSSDVVEVLNLNNKCWGLLGCRGGPCEYCGTGFCCKKGSYRGGCDGLSGLDSAYVCTPAPTNITTPMNLGKECWNAGNCRSGRCGLCGTGLCCRKGRTGGGCTGVLGGPKNHVCVPPIDYNDLEKPKEFAESESEESEDVTDDEVPILDPMHFAHLSGLTWNPQALTPYGRALDVAKYYMTKDGLSWEAAQQKVMLEFPDVFKTPIPSKPVQPQFEFQS